MFVRGFTFVELMVTLAIIAVLASIALPMAELTIQRQKERELRSALRQIRTALDAFKETGDEGRIVRRSGESGYPRTLRFLVDGVDDAKDPARRKIYFLRRIPRDPMFADQSARAEITWALRSYASPSDQPRPGDDVFDVRSKSEKVGLNGVPYSEW
jgi:general secretion pathway protein G